MQPLGNLKAGDCFEHFVGDYYIVTDQELETDEVACVNLETGEVADFTLEAQVFKLDAIITLRRIGEET